MNSFWSTFKDGVLSYIKTFLKWVICASIIGVVCGIMGTMFHFAVDQATEWREEYEWFLYLLPFAGLFIIFLYRKCNLEEAGTNLILHSVKTTEKIPLLMLPLIFIGTALTHLCGGSSGREGAALQIGGSIGAFLGRRFHLTEYDMRVVTMCGMSAVFSALFGTPLTATIFSMEVISVGVLYHAAFVPCLISSIVACEIAGFSGIAPTSFLIAQIPKFSLVTALQVIMLAVACAMCSVLFCVIMHKSGKYYKKYIANSYVRAFVGGCLIVLLTLLVQTRDYNGAGMNVITNAVAGTARPEAFILKIIFTAVTLGAGFKGGEIVPTFFIGATFGNLIGGFLGLNAGFSAGIGIIALFCGVVNCPIASIVLSVELFGGNGLLFFALAAAVSYMLSGYYSLYSSQTIVYSKLEMHYINQQAK